MAKKRFSVSVDEADYVALDQMAKGHSPPLSMTYVVNYAIKRLLDQARDPQKPLDLGDPLRSRRRDG